MNFNNVEFIKDVFINFIFLDGDVTSPSFGIIAAVQFGEGAEVELKIINYKLDKSSWYSINHKM
jgi:hypothetical protein